MIDALAFAAALWTHPGSAPCATDAGNPCWTGPIPTEAGEICDGDLVHMWGAQDGEMIGPWLMLVALDVDHLRAMGFRYWTREDGATCIPTLTDGERHLVEACGNPAEVIKADSITAAVFRHIGYMRGGGLSIPSAGTSTGGGAGAHVAAPPIPGVVVWPRTPIVEPHEPSPPPPPIVSLPASLGLLLGALAALALVGMKRRA